MIVCFIILFSLILRLNCSQNKAQNVNSLMLSGHFCLAYQISRIYHWCSLETGKSQPEGPAFKWETRLCQVSQFNGGPEGWDLLSLMIDSFSHILNFGFSKYMYDTK